MLKQGTLRKLGGKDKDTWEPREFELTSEGLCWAAKAGSRRTLAAQDIVRAAV